MTDETKDDVHLKTPDWTDRADYNLRFVEPKKPTDIIPTADLLADLDEARARLVEAQALITKLTEENRENRLVNDSVKFISECLKTLEPNVLKMKADKEILVEAIETYLQSEAGPFENLVHRVALKEALEKVKQ